MGLQKHRKVLIILKELNVPFDHRIIELSDVKGEPLLSVNPNGRLPAIEDPNTGMRLWEVELLAIP